MVTGAQLQKMRRDAIGFVDGDFRIALGKRCYARPRAERGEELITKKANDSLMQRSAVAQKIAAGAIEQIAMLHHHPMPATVKDHEACLRTPVDYLHRAADGIETIIGAPEAEHRAADLA